MIAFPTIFRGISCKNFSLGTHEQTINNQREHNSLPNITEIINSQETEIRNGIPKKCFLQNNIIMNKRKGFTRYYLPENLRSRVINHIHTEYGHIGLSKMIIYLSKLYYWPNINSIHLD